MNREEDCSCMYKFSRNNSKVTYFSSGRGRLCYCGKNQTLVTSWTNENLSRRFFACANYWVSCIDTSLLSMLTLIKCYNSVILVNRNVCMCVPLQEGNSSCNFFERYDECICERGKIVIPQQIKKILELEERDFGVGPLSKILFG